MSTPDEAPVPELPVTDPRHPKFRPWYQDRLDEMTEVLAAIKAGTARPMRSNPEYHGPAQRAFHEGRSD